LINFFRRPNSIFIALFFAMLCIPMLHISDATKSDTENRLLAHEPHLFAYGSINSKFGTEFDAWFNDRFFGRNIMVKLHDTVFRTRNNSGNGKFLIGNDNWLFFYESIQSFSNAKLFSNKDLERITTYIRSIDNWCKQNDVKFLFVIAPDKHRIYGENVRWINKVRPDSDSKIEHLLDYIAENSDVHTLYLKDTLMAHKDDGLLYYKNDTHWNNYGAYLGYLHIMEHLQSTPVEPLSIDTEQMCSGDLTNMTTSIPQDCDSVYKLPVFPNSAICDPYKNHEDVHCKNSKGHRRIFVLRDSFTSGLIKYFNETFSVTDYKWRYDILASDLKYIQESNIDTVMLIMIERHVYQLKDIEFSKD